MSRRNRLMLSNYTQLTLFSTKAIELLEVIPSPHTLWYVPFSQFWPTLTLKLSWKSVVHDVVYITQSIKAIKLHNSRDTFNWVVGVHIQTNTVSHDSTINTCCDQKYIETVQSSITTSIKRERAITRNKHVYEYATHRKVNPPNCVLTASNGNSLRLY